MHSVGGFSIPNYKEEKREMEKSTMSVQELSAQMGISLPKAYELVKTEGFPAMRIGTRILISVEGFHKWLAEQTERRLQS